MFNNKARLIEDLTGVNSSRLNYYVELKKRNEEIVKQNNRLEIIHQLTRDINIDMSINDIIDRVYKKLPLAIPCDFLGLALIRQNELHMTAMTPPLFSIDNPIPQSSFLWQCFRDGQTAVFDSSSRVLQGETPPLAEYLQSLVVAPLFVRTVVYGLLIVGSAQRAAYSTSELNFANHLADQLAVYLQNMKLFKEVSRAKREWEETFRAVTEPILLIDTSHNILRCNGRLPSEMLGAKVKSKNIKCFALLWGREDICKNCLMNEVKETLKPAYRRVQMDSGVVLDITYYPVFNEDGNLTAVIHHMKDISEKTKMEAQLVQSAKLAAIGEMAAGVAHELNNPMTVMIGTAQLLLRETGEESRESELLKDIVNCGLRCKKIIQNLLAFSRQYEYHLAPTDLNQDINIALQLFQHQINLNNINIQRNLYPDLPKIVANGHQIQQVLINLLLNARDALEAREENRLVHVFSSLRENGGKKWAVITVADNGVGISPENITKVFNPFYTSKETSKGTGLGLSVSLGIAEAHGGTIEVKSKPGEGSSFSLVLPVEGC